MSSVCVCVFEFTQNELRATEEALAAARAETSRRDAALAVQRDALESEAATAVSLNSQLEQARQAQERLEAEKAALLEDKERMEAGLTHQLDVLKDKIELGEQERSSQGASLEKYARLESVMAAALTTARRAAEDLQQRVADLEEEARVVRSRADQDAALVDQLRANNEDMCKRLEVSSRRENRKALTLFVRPINLDSPCSTSLSYLLGTPRLYKPLSPCCQFRPLGSLQCVLACIRFLDPHLSACFHCSAYTDRNRQVYSESSASRKVGDRDEDQSQRIKNQSCRAAQGVRGDQVEAHPSAEAFSRQPRRPDNNCQATSSSPG